jgi:hypothetical protein
MIIDIPITKTEPIPIVYLLTNFLILAGNSLFFKNSNSLLNDKNNDVKNSANKTTKIVLIINHIISPSFIFSDTQIYNIIWNYNQ